MACMVFTTQHLLQLMKTSDEISFLGVKYKILSFKGCEVQCHREKLIGLSEWLLADLGVGSVNLL